MEKGSRTWPTIVIPSRPRYLPIASQIHGPTIPSSRRHSRSVLQAEKKGQHRPAESLRQLHRTELDRHQHLAAVLLECLPKSHPDKQGRRRMAQRAQQTSAGKKLASLVHADQLLHEESRLTTLQIRMVSKHKLCKLPRRTYRQLQAKMFSLWIQYENGDRTAKQLLRTDREIINNPTVERSY